MKMIKIPLIILFLLCFTPKLKAQYIQIDDTYTAQQLVEDVLIDSDCASVSNFSVTGGDFGGRENSYGYFDGGTSSFPFVNGIILSTGRALIAQGPNNSLSDDGRGMNWPGDQDLEQALEIGRSTDATILEFDFTPLSNKISFDYMLSSEEYHDNAPCNYADGFAFLLKQAGSTAAYQNLALVPGKTIPVNTMNIRPEIGGIGGCRAENEEYFGGFNDVEHPTNFNGQTVVMKAQADVIPGITYHIKLVIADEGNYRYDSAIFLGGGSFKVETNLGANRLLANNTALCQNETLTLTATNPNAISYEWFKNGIPQTEISDQFAISVNESATYSVKVGLGGTCFSTGEIIIEYAPAIVLPNVTLIQCDENNDGLALFNLNHANDQITGGNPDLSNPLYFRTYAEAFVNTNSITNPDAFENTISKVFARVENEFGCFSISEITLAVSNNALADADTLEECDDNNDGLAIFNLTDNESLILANLPGGNLKYYTSYRNALLAINPIANQSAFENTEPFNQTIYAKLSSGIDCYGIAKFEIIVNSFGGSLADEEAVVCLNNIAGISLNAGSGFSSYNWNTNPVQNTQRIRVTQPGTYTVTVTNSKGCEGIKNFFVKASSRAIIASVTVNDFNGGRNSVTINLTPDSIGDYEYSINGVTFQDSPTFSNVNSGEYVAYVIDKNFCGSANPYDFFVMDYPKFFSPNGDGKNEIWSIPYLNSQPNATVSIFDRYGKLVYFFKGNQRGWDGIFNGQKLPATDYWFKITLQSGREIKGHFSLLR